MDHEKENHERLINELLLPKDRPLTPKQYEKNRAHLDAYLAMCRQLYGETNESG